MVSGPYRQPSPSHGSPAERESHALDRTLWPVAVVVWVACVARVVFVLSRGDTLGTDASIAAVVVVLLPMLFARRLVAWASGS